MSKRKIDLEVEDCRKCPYSVVYAVNDVVHATCHHPGPETPYLIMAEHGGPEAAILEGVEIPAGCPLRITEDEE